MWCTSSFTRKGLYNSCSSCSRIRCPCVENIPNFLSHKIESIQKRAMCIIFPLMNYNEALNALNLTTLCERRAHLCQVYIDRLRNENHPLHLLLPKWEEFVHNYNLRSGVSCITRPSCRTKRTQSLSLISTSSGLYWFYMI